MNNSAFDHINGGTDDRSPETASSYFGMDSDNMLAYRAFRRGAAQQLSTVPVQARSLLAAQRLSLQSRPALCVYADFRAAQRHYSEVAATVSGDEHHLIIIHEMMPVFQQEYLLQGLEVLADLSLSTFAVVFTSRAYFQRLQKSHPHVVSRLEVVDVTAEDPVAADPLGEELPTITCICLRKSSMGRWVLMDHEPAAVVSRGSAPEEDLVRRLMRHTVSISGTRLAPYLAMMFDVPNAWKVHPELASCALLVFDDDQCPMGCVQPGVPHTILWNDLLGIIYRD